jgi:hypothetical protein
MEPAPQFTKAEDDFASDAVVLLKTGDLRIQFFRKRLLVIQSLLGPFIELEIEAVVLANDVVDAFVFFVC